MAESSDPSRSSSEKQVKGILKKTKRESVKQRFDGDHSGIQWDEMNILMTESPVDKDYGHIKIDEPKTPYHEMAPDEEGGGTPPDKVLSPDDLAKKVIEAAGSEPSSRWEPDSSGEDDREDEFLTEEQKKHKKEFQEWRKHHYNEFQAVQRARELMRQDEDELRRLEEDQDTSQTQGMVEDIKQQEDEAMQQDSGTQT